MRLGVGVHADAAVGDAEQDVRARHHGWMLAGVRFVEDDVARLDGEAAAVGHGVARVDGEVQDHLLELARVGAHGGEIGSERGGELNVLADQPPQHRLQVGDDGIELEQLGREHLAAAVGEQLPGEVGGAGGGFADLLEIVAHRVAGRHVAHQ